MDNISLESMFHWLSKDVLKFEVDAGIYEQLANMYVTVDTQNGRSAAQCSVGDVRTVTG